MNRETIRPIYMELQGYLSQAPKPADRMEIYEETFWNQLNNAINLLNEITGNDYNRFAIEPKFETGVGKFIDLNAYRLKLGGLINNLYGQYFPDEAEPFSGKPSTIINQQQSQNQHQQVFVKILFDVRDKIDEKLPTLADGSPEKTFLQKLKDSLSSISSIAGLLNTIFTLASQYGVSIDQLSTIFK